VRVSYSVYCATVHLRLPASFRGFSGTPKPAQMVDSAVIRPNAGDTAEHSKCGGRKPLGVRVPPPPFVEQRNNGPVALAVAGPFSLWVMRFSAPREVADAGGEEAHLCGVAGAGCVGASHGGERERERGRPGDVPATVAHGVVPFQPALRYSLSLPPHSVGAGGL
jgi:hypothetical protein